jgi:RNA polymerase sigma-32 factor
MARRSASNTCHDQLSNFATLIIRWREHSDPDAAQRLVTSHLRLVAKIAIGYRGYGLPISEVISEGNIGLMQAIKRFEPDKGFRLATYAMWWIKARGRS